MAAHIIGKDDCAPAADTILNEAYKPPDNKLTPLQIAHFENLQWKNKKKPIGKPTMNNPDHIKKGFK